MGASLSNPVRHICQVNVFVLTVDRPDAAEAIPVPPGYDMEVQVEDGLLGSLACRSNEVHAFRRQCCVDRAANADHRRYQLSAQRGLHFPKVLDVSPRNNQRVSRGSGVERKERHPGLLLAHQLDRAISALGNRAEGALLPGGVAFRHLPAALAACSIQSPMLW